MHCNLSRPTPRQSLSALITTAMPSLKSLNLSIVAFTADTLVTLWPLILWPDLKHLTWNICSLLPVPWLNALLLQRLSLSSFRHCKCFTQFIQAVFCSHNFTPRLPANSINLIRTHYLYGLSKLSIVQAQIQVVFKQFCIRTIGCFVRWLNTRVFCRRDGCEL